MAICTDTYISKRNTQISLTTNVTVTSLVRLLWQKQRLPQEGRVNQIFEKVVNNLETNLLQEDKCNIEMQCHSIICQAG